MNRLLAVLLVVFAAASSRASTETESVLGTGLLCGHASALAPPDSPDHRKYPRDLEARVLHIALDITPDFSARTIRGLAVLHFQPNVLPVSEIRLDAVDLQVRSVKSSEAIAAHQVTDQEIVVTYQKPIPPERTFTVTIEYGAEPRQGLYFRTPEMGYLKGDTHLFTQGESITARHWYPCVDAPNVMCTTEVTCRVPAGMTVISNGRLLSEQADPASGLTMFHWKQEQPHANYLVTLVAGFFARVEDKHGEIPLAFFTPPSDSAHATNSFRGTREMMEFFEKETGVPYPWPKYYQVCVNDFVAGGMENTSATTLTDSTLFSSETENLHSSEGLVAHELAHQWFGDLVTCKDWSHLWLNEGFATYYEALWQGHRHGVDELRYEMFNTAETILRAGGTPQPIVRRTYDRPDHMFDYLAYQKGGWVLHMLRAQLGVERYQKCVRLLLERHRHSNAATEDFRRIIEEVSGRSYDQFFDQWLYHAHHPELDINYTWDQAARLARLSVKQSQRLSTNVLLFNVPLTVQFHGKFGSVKKTLPITRAEEDFSVGLESAPEWVRIDPDLELLAKINFTPSAAMLTRQLEQKDDVIGRLLAVEAIGKRRDGEAVKQLKRVLNEDSHYGVRLAASRGLRAIRSDEALEALVASTSQPDARVRNAVARDLGGFYADRAYESALRALDSEKNPAIRGNLLRNLSGYAKPEVRGILEQHLNSTSYRNELVDSAIEALRLHDDPASVPALLKVLADRSEVFSSGGFGRGLNALAYLARNEEDKSVVREFLVRQLGNERRGVKASALTALGALGDPRAIAVVQKFAGDSRQERERAAAESALARLRSERRPVDDFKNLRQEVLDLQKSDRDLRKELEDLKKRLKELQSIFAVTNSQKAPVPQKPDRKRRPDVRSPKAA